MGKTRTSAKKPSFGTSKKRSKGEKKGGGKHDGIVASVRDRTSMPKAVAAAASEADDGGKDQSSAVVYIGHVPHGFYEDQMRGFFSQFGEVKQVRLSRSKKTGRSKGYAFVEFESHTVARIAAEAMHNYYLVDKYLQCRVLSANEVHPTMFRGAERKFRVVPWRKIERRRREQPRTPEQVQSRLHRLKSKEEKQRQRLKEAGIDYDFDGLRGTTVAAPSGRGVKRARDTAIGDGSGEASESGSDSEDEDFAEEQGDSGSEEEDAAALANLEPEEPMEEEEEDEDQPPVGQALAGPFPSDSESDDEDFAEDANEDDSDGEDAAALANLEPEDFEEDDSDDNDDDDDDNSDESDGDDAESEEEEEEEVVHKEPSPAMTRAQKRRARRSSNASQPREETATKPTTGTPAKRKSAKTPAKQHSAETTAASKVAKNTPKKNAPATPQAKTPQAKTPKAKTPTAKTPTAKTPKAKTPKAKIVEAEPAQTAPVGKKTKSRLRAENGATPTPAGATKKVKSATKVPRAKRARKA